LPPDRDPVLEKREASDPLLHLSHLRHPVLGCHDREQGGRVQGGPGRALIAFLPFSWKESSCSRPNPGGAVEKPRDLRHCDAPGSTVLSAIFVSWPWERRSRAASRPVLSPLARMAEPILSGANRRLVPNPSQTQKGI